MALTMITSVGSFDSAVHISEEASNAAIAVPWAIVGAIFVAGVLGWAINVSLAFCMGTDLESIVDKRQKSWESLEFIERLSVLF